MKYVSTEAYSEPCQTYKVERFAKTVKDWKPLAIFAKRPVLDVWLSSEHDQEKSVWIGVQARVRCLSYRRAQL